MWRAAVTAGVAVLLLATPHSAAQALPRGDSLFELSPSLSGYSLPVAAVSDGSPRRLFIVEQTGRIHVAKRASVDDPWVKAGVFLDLRDRITGPFGSHGLLALAFHPDYATNGRFYVWYNRQHDDPAKNGDAVLEEFRRSTALTADPASRRRLLLLPQPSIFHAGGWLTFGPDRMLYLSTGDGAASFAPAQDLTSRLGKLLRIDPRDPPGPARFTIPPDNPFVGRFGDDAIWAYGLRNPWRGSFDRQTGAMWLADVGETHFEEVNRAASATAAKGRNYGWSVCEGRHARDPSTEPPPLCTTPGLALPLIEYDHGESRCSVTGGYVYRGTRQPSILGRYLFADFCTGSIWSVPASHHAGDPLPPPLESGLNIASFAEDGAGELYVMDREGGILHIVGH